ncbi:PhoP regulatory network protein YrbL [Bordetella pertussis]|nr:PhoP regulatory network protein YrbL [Bordetella pertussis]
MPGSGYAAMFGPLDLSQARLLAQGGDRYVFQHPHEPALLVKVMDMEARAVYLEARRSSAGTSNSSGKAPTAST